MILNVDKFSYIAHKPFFAITMWSRFRGMIANKFSRQMDAMVFAKCNAIHTFFMTQNIDVIFLNKSGWVVGLFKSLKPWRPIVRVGMAYFVIELPEGAIAESLTEIGDNVNLNMEMTKEGIAKTKYRAILYKGIEVSREVNKEQ